MAEKALTAILGAQETISEALGQVSEALEDVAEAAGVADETLEQTEETTDQVTQAMAQAKATLQSAEEGFEGVSVEAKQAAISEEDLVSSTEELRNAQVAMKQATDSAERGLAEESQTFTEAMISAESLADAKDAASRANSVLTGTAKSTQDAIEEEIGAMYRMAVAADTGEELLTDLRNSNMALAMVADEVADEIKDMTAAQAANTIVTKIHDERMEELKESINDVGEEARETALELAGLGGAFAATSLNIGPFNVALREAAVQIPQLVTAAGTLATALGGVATAAATAGSALAGIYGGGVLAMAQQMARTNSEYKNTMEALQGVMKDVRGTFMRALEPLANQQNVQMFKDAITGLASALNLAAQLVNNLREELDAFLSRVSTAFFENANAIMRELHDTVEVFLPILGDFFVWFIEKLPAALQFFQDEGVQAIQMLAKFGRQFLNFFRAFSELGVAAFQGVLFAISGVLESLRIVADILNALPNEVIATATAFLILSRAMSGAVGMGLSLGRFFGGLSASIRESRTALGLFNSVLAAFQLTSAQEALGLLAQKFDKLDELAAASSEAAVESMREIQSLDVGDELAEGMDDVPETLGTRLTNAVTAARNKLSSLGTRFASAFTSAKNKLLGSRTMQAALGVEMVGGTMKDQLGSGEFTTARKQIIKRFKQAGSLAVAPFKRLGSALTSAGGAAVELGSRLKTGLSSMTAFNRGANSIADAINARVLPAVDAFGRRAGSVADTIGNKVLNNLHSLNMSLKRVGSLAVAPFRRLGSSLTGFVNRGANSLANVINARVLPAVDAFGRRAGAVADTIGNKVLNNLHSLNMSFKQLALAPFRAAKGLATFAATALTSGVNAAFATLNTVGLRAALAGVAQQSIPVISSLAAMATSFLGLAAAEGVTTAATMTLKAALSSIGITQIIAGIAVLIAVAGTLAGILGNLDAITSAASSSMSALKSALHAVFNALIKVGVPVWNLFITILEAVLSFVFATIDAFNYLLETFGLIGKDGGGIGSFFGMLGQILGVVIDSVASLVSMFKGPLNAVADIIYAAIYIPLTLIVDVLKGIVNIIGMVIQGFMSLSIVQAIAQGINDAVTMLTGAWGAMMGVVDAAVKMAKNAIEGLVNTAIRAINSLVRELNKLPKVNIDKLDTFSFGGGGGAGGASKRLAEAEVTAQSARKNAKQLAKNDKSNASGPMAAGRKTEYNKYETNNYEFGDFKMKPEEKARVKGLVQEAIEEANRTKRLRNGSV